MRLVSLRANGFRNLEPFTLGLDAPFVVFHGENGQGKTNALEAIHLLAALKPLRGRGRELVRFGASSAVVRGEVAFGGVTRAHEVRLEGSGREARVDDKSVRSILDYFDGFRAVVFVPSDLDVVSGEPARRRAWIDRAAFTASPSHLELVLRVRRIIAQKSALLRGNAADVGLLDALDADLAATGARLSARRASMLEQLMPYVSAVYRDIAGEDEPVAMSWRGDAAGADLASRADALAEALASARPDELRRGVVLRGPQRDEVRIGLRGQDARTYASRGQIRSLVLSLKLAELLAARDRGVVPPFLLDDVGSELDAGRMNRLVGVLTEVGAQLFATTTDPRWLSALPRSETLRVTVRRGILTPDLGDW